MEYPVFNVFHPQPYADPTHDTNNKGRCFNITPFRSIGYLHWYRFHK